MSGAGNGNNSGHNDHSKHIDGKGKGTHFSREELFMYMHQSNRSDGVWRVMHQHMLTCPECREQVAELEQSEYILRTTLSPKNDMLYASIAGPVMERIYAEKSTGARRRFGTQHPSRLSVAFVAVIASVLLIITIGSTFFARQSMHSITGSVATPTSVFSVPQQHATPKPTMQTTPKPGPTAVKPVVSQGVTLLECTNNFDEVKQHLRICGSNFKAGDNIVFTLVDSKNRPMKEIGPIQVQNDGTFSQNISIHSCKDVPSVIYAQDTSIKKSEVYTELTGIWYPNCQGS